MAVRLGLSWQVYSERGCLFCHGPSCFATVSVAGFQFCLFCHGLSQFATVSAGSNSVSDRLYSDSLDEIGPSLTKVKLPPINVVLKCILEILKEGFLAN